MELFLHPWYMVAGGALISSPIIIHLINRMRFKRIRWAAMEFLLKSQKRNRRRLIIEQLILLLLRILLVLLVAFLVARFVGGALGNTGQGTMHVVILDDTPEHGRPLGRRRGTSTPLFQVAREQIKQVARKAALASSAQEMQIFLLSDLLGRFKVTDESLAVLGTKTVPADVLAKLKPLLNEAYDREQFLEELEQRLGEEDLKRFEQALLRETDTARPKYDHRLDSRSEEDIGKALDSFGPQALHVDPIVGVRKARDLFNAAAQGQKVLHVASDFRDLDWASNAKELNAEIDKLIEAGVNVSLLDTGHPFRNETRDIILNHDNLAITDFRAESRMAAEGVPLEFTVKVHNFGSKDEKSFLNVYIDGSKDKDFTASVPLDNLPANAMTEQKFTLIFQKKKAGQEYIVVSAQLNREESGLQIDNVRDLVVDVRKKIPALIVDGAGREGQKPGGDSFHLEIGLLGSRAYEAEYKTLEELAGLNLDVYPSIWFLNVPEIKNKPTVDKLQKYVAAGGSIAWFMGDKVSSTFYNKVLHEEMKGLFPVKLAARYTDPLTPEEREFRKQRDPQPKILFRDKEHPVVKEGLYPQRLAFQPLLIDRYWPTLPRSQWNPENEKEKVDEVITLPNRNSIDAYKTRAQELARAAVEETEVLGKIDESFKKYEAPMKNSRRKMTEALGKGLLFNVVAVVDRMLEDPGEPKNPDRPSMPELWANAKMKTLHGQLKDFRDTLLYGDPLVVTRPYGKGRVAVCLTTAGTASNWNDWGAGSPAQWSYPVFIGDLQALPDQRERRAQPHRQRRGRHQPGVRRRQEAARGRVHFLAPTRPGR